MTKFLSVSKRNPCPVCEGVKDCRTLSESKILLCKRQRGDVPGFKYLGEAENPLWGKFLPLEIAEWEEWLPQWKREKPKPAAIVPRDELHREYEIHQKRSLWDKHREDLTRRGLSEAEIEVLKPFSTIAGGSGYTIAFRDVDGFLCGAQTRFDTGETRYKWYTPRSDWDKHNPFGEMPLAVWQPTEPKPGAIVLAEGTGIKPYLAAKRLGVTAIGAAGANWQAQTLTDTLQKLTASEVWIAPDAGMLGNRNILGNYQKAQELAENLGITVKFLWWGQTQKNHADIDELGEETIAYLTPDQFWDLCEVNPKTIGGIFDRSKNWLKNIFRKRPKPIGFKSEPVPQTFEIEYQPGERLAVWGRSEKYILDRSGTGSGKSYDAGMLKERVFYVSNEHRNPTVKTLQDWYDLEARHNGLVTEPTPDGGKRFRRAKKGQIPSTPANCTRSGLLNALREKTIDADKASMVCRSCPLYEACCHGEGSGYGYLHQRQVALGRDRLRLHPSSMPDPDQFQYGEATIVWDESTINFNNYSTIQVTGEDITQTIGTLVDEEALSPELVKLMGILRKILDDRQALGRYGLAHKDLLKKLPEQEYNLESIEQALDPQKWMDKLLNPTKAYGVDLSDLPSSQRKFYDQAIDLNAMPKAWLTTLIQILQGEFPGGTIAVSHGGFTLTIPNDRHRMIAQTAQKNIFLDATLTREDLALKLGVNPGEILVVREKPIETPNQKIYQVADLGRLGRDRGKDQTLRVEKIIQTLNAPAIDFKDQNREGSHFVDGRGVNYFETANRIIIVGTPCPNLLALLGEFCALTGTIVNFDNPDFQAWVHRKIEAELIQEVGRTRANRRLNEKIEVYLLTDFQFSTIAPIQITSASINPEAAPKGERLSIAVIEAAKAIIKAGKTLTQEDLAGVLERSRGAILKAINRLGQTWEEFKTMILLLVEAYIAKGSKESDPDLPVNNFICAIVPWLDFDQVGEFYSLILQSEDPDPHLFGILADRLDRLSLKN